MIFTTEHMCKILAGSIGRKWSSIRKRRVCIPCGISSDYYYAKRKCCTREDGECFSRERDRNTISITCTRHRLAELGKNGELSGTTGQAKAIEAMHISLVNATAGGNIEYRAHVQDIGWQGWVKMERRPVQPEGHFRWKR